MNFDLPKEVKNILEKFEKAGYQIYIVGGAVRDLLMEKSVTDWDFTTNATPEEILKLYPDGFYDNKFGTVGIKSSAISSQLSDNKQNKSDDRRLTTDDSIFEITTMRKEGIYKDARHPIEVSWTDKIEEDLNRRDFTINAIALPLGGETIDPFDGQTDIKNKLIRAVGNPDLRFREDALRMMRAIRIACQLQFEIENKTYQEIKTNVELIKQIAWERIRDELFKILASSNPVEGFLKLKDTGILKIILPELDRCFGLQQEGPKHARIYDIGEHSLSALNNCPSKDPIVRFASLMHDVGKPDTVHIQPDGNVTFYNHDFVGGKLIREIAKRFNLSNKQSEKLYLLVRWHMFTLDENQTDSAIRRFIKNIGVENIQDMMDVRVADRLGGGTQTAVSWRMEKFQERIKQVLQKPFSISDLKVNGKDVMETLSIPSGKQVGQILQKLFEEVQEDSEKNNREYLLEQIKKI